MLIFLFVLRYIIFFDSTLKKYCFEIPSHDFKSININGGIGFQAPYSNMQSPLVVLWNKNMNDFNVLRGKCLVCRDQKDGKYLLSDMTYNGGMYTFITK